jgi:hypothetical protein
MGSAQIDVKISLKGRQPNKESATKPLCRYVSPATGPAYEKERHYVTHWFALTAKSSTASAAAHDPRRFEISSCTDRRSSCTFATSWTYGSGTCACSISNKVLKTDHTPLCLGGRGASPPQYCGGPRGYRLMLKRQQEGGAIADPASVEATIRMLAWTNPDQPARRWDLLRETSMKDGEALSDDWNNTGLWNPIALASRRPTSGCRCSWRAGECGHEVPNRSDLRKRERRRRAK